MKKDETIFLLKFLIFVIGVLLVTFPFWFPAVSKRWIGIY